MKQIILFYLFTSLLVLNVNSTSTEPKTKRPFNPDCEQYSTSLKYLSKIKFRGTEKVLNIGYEQEDLNAYIARNCIPNGLMIGIDPDEKRIKKATRDYSGIQNLHMIHMDALCFDFNGSIDIIMCPFSQEWTYDTNTIVMIVTNVARSLKFKGKFYLWLDASNDNCSLITAALVQSNNYSEVTYRQSSNKKVYAIKAIKK